MSELGPDVPAPTFVKKKRMKNNNGYVWYRDPTVWKSSATCLGLGVAFSVGATWVDGVLNLQALYLMGGAAVLIPGLAFLFRKNP